MVSDANAKGAGASPCGDTFNPAYIPASAGLATPGLLLRMASCNRSAMPSGEHIGFAPCDLKTGKCGDVVEGFNFGDGDEDPRAFYCDGTAPGCAAGNYYNFYYDYPGQGSGGPGPPCVGRLCTVSLKRTKTPLNASSWEFIATVPWHRNGCCILRKTPPHYCIFGEGSSQKFQREFSSAGPWPMAGLGMATTMDFDSGVFAVRAVPGRLSALSVFLLKSVLYGAFVWARRALNSRKRRFPARAVGVMHEDTAEVL